MDKVKWRGDQSGECILCDVIAILSEMYLFDWSAQRWSWKVPPLSHRYQQFTCKPSDIWLLAVSITWRPRVASLSDKWPCSITPIWFNSTSSMTIDRIYYWFPLLSWFDLKWRQLAKKEIRTTIRILFPFNRNDNYLLFSRRKQRNRQFLLKKQYL